MSLIRNIKILSPLEKIYPGDSMPREEYKSFSMLKNEKKSFQVAVEADADGIVSVKCSGTLKNISICRCENIKSDFPIWSKDTDGYFRLSESGYYPDLLLPSEDNISLKKGITSLWLEVDASVNTPGRHTAEIYADGKSAAIEIEIIDARLDFGDFIYTCWFHTDCLMSYYGFEAFSEEYWRVTQSFLKTAADYGMNCVLTPLFTPPLDTAIGGERPTVQLVDVTVERGSYCFGFEKLERWIETAQSCGIKHFELSHFFTQWGARKAPKIMAIVDGEYKRIFGWDTKAMSKEYKDFLRAFSSELKKYIEEKGLRNNVLIHVSDEPNFSVIFPYARASRYIRSLFPGYKITDALSDYWFYRLGLVANPIPANDHIDKFLGRVKDLWVYYCSAQKSHCVSNRFFCNASLRTRVIGYQMYKYDIKGFLHWGYNFYYKRLSKGLVDPYKVTDAGGEFPSGDSFIVYPAENGTAHHSLRLRVFYDALQDMAALRTLEALTDKKTCLDIIEQEGRHNITFREYPHDNLWLLTTRQKINEAIKENMP